MVCRTVCNTLDSAHCTHLVSGVHRGVLVTVPRTVMDTATTGSACRSLSVYMPLGSGAQPACVAESRVRVSERVSWRDLRVCVRPPRAPRRRAPGGAAAAPRSPFSHKTQPVVVRSPNKYVLDIERETTQTRMVIMDTSDAHVDAICEERSRSRPFLRRRFEPKQSAPASSFFRLQRSSALADWRIRSVVEAHIARQNLLVELRRCHH